LPKKRAIWGEKYLAREIFEERSILGAQRE
jgi:hypothetical protein